MGRLHWAAMVPLAALLLAGAAAGAKQVRMCGVVEVVHPELGILLGGVANGKWASDEQMARHLPGGERYRLYTMTKFLGEARGAKPRPGDDAPTSHAFLVTVRPAPPSDSAVIAVGGAWNALPRVPRLEGVDQPLYREVVREILRQKGIAEPQVHITQVLRVDLDGDGTDEVLISATNDRPNRISAHNPQPGDYSVVVLRRLVAGKVKSTVVAGEYFVRQRYEGEAAPNILSVAAVLDLNGDGAMEVLVGWEYHEGSGIEAYVVHGTKARRVFGSGAGV